MHSTKRLLPFDQVATEIEEEFNTTLEKIEMVILRKSTTFFMKI